MFNPGWIGLLSLFAQAFTLSRVEQKKVSGLYLKKKWLMLTSLFFCTNGKLEFDGVEIPALRIPIENFFLQSLHSGDRKSATCQNRIFKNEVDGMKEESSRCQGW